MRILQICNKAPFPPRDGGCIAMNNLTEGLLQQGHRVKVLAVNTARHFVKAEELPQEYRARTEIELVYIDTAVKPLPALLNLFSSDSYNITRFYSPAFEQRLAGILRRETFDLIQLESLYVSMYAGVIRRHSSAKIVLRAHNVEHRLWERNAAAADNLAERLYFNFLAKRLKKYETEVLASLDAIAAITEEDAAWFRQHSALPVEVVPFGIDMKAIAAGKTEACDAYSVFHIGAMDWQPNVEGVKWFLEKVWGRVHEKHPSLKLYLAGKSMSDEFRLPGYPNVIIAGEVENAHRFIRSKGLMLSPLLSGGGMRVKIIEGMALGKVVLTTPVGAEGIDCTNGVNILVAGDAEGFISAIGNYINDPQHCHSIGESARQLVAAKYDNSGICTRLTAFYRGLVQEQQIPVYI